MGEILGEIIAKYSIKMLYSLSFYEGCGGGRSPERTLLALADFPVYREFTGKSAGFG
jgi:hypothetical protein